MPIWEAYALKWAGPLKASGAVTMWNRDWDQQKERNYYLWCLLGPHGPVVIDSGVAPQAIEGRDLPGYENPAQVLARLGVDAAQVRHLFLTHLHWDHALGISLFPRAKVYVQQAEYDFWTTHPAAKLSVFKLLGGEMVAAGVELAKSQGRLELLEGEGELLPGLSYLLAPGHTPGLMAAVAQTQTGACVLGSDCGHTRQNYAELWPSIFVTDMAQALLSMDKLRQAAGSEKLLIPGHDLALMSDYPQVAPGVTRLA